MNAILPYRRKHFRNAFSNLYSNDLNGTDEWVDHGVASELLYQYTDSFSFSIWFKPDANGLLSGLITYNGSVANAGGGWMVVYQVDKLRFYIQDGGSLINIESNTTITNGTWNHVVCTVSSGKLMQMYVNKVLQTATYTYGSISYTIDDCTLRLGKFGDIRFFDGRIAYPKIFNKELSQTEGDEDYDLKMGDWRGLSFTSNVKYAGIYPNGQADYPTLTDDVAGINGTMQNQEDTDINTDVPT